MVRRGKGEEALTAKTQRDAKSFNARAQRVQGEEVKRGKGEEGKRDCSLPQSMVLWVRRFQSSADVDIEPTPDQRAFGRWSAFLLSYGTGQSALWEPGLSLAS
jgi:hypothetical protein